MGNGESTAKTATSVGIGVGLAVTTFFFPPLGAPLTTTYVYGGAAAYGLGKVVGSEDLAEAGKVIYGGANISKEIKKRIPKWLVAKHCPKIIVYETC